MISDPTSLPPVALSSTAASTPSEGARGDAQGRWWWALAGVAIAAAVVVRVVVSRSAVAPRTPWDENGLLQMARVIAGQTDVPPMDGAGYFPGFSFFIAPVWWFTDHAPTVYIASLWIAIAFGLATFVPLTLLARRLGVDTPRAIVAAGVVMLLPALTANADYVLSESALMFWVAWSAVAVFAVWERPSYWRMALAVAAVLMAFLTHARALLLVIVLGIWLLGFLRRNLKVALVGFALLVPGMLGVQAIAKSITDAVLIGEFRQNELVLDTLATTNPSLLLQVMLTQTWAQLVGTLGLVAVGGIVVALWTFRDLVKWRTLGPSAYVFGSALAAALLSFAAWSGPASHFRGTAPRLDSWVYTRYIDPFVAIAVLVAVTVLIRKLSGRVLVTALAASTAVVLATVYWAARPIATWGTMDGPVNASGVLAFVGLLPSEPFPLPHIPTLTNEGRFWVVASIVVIVSQLTMLALRTRPRVLATVLVVGMAAYSLVANPSQARETPDNLQYGVERAESVAGEQLPVDFALGCATASGFQRSQALNWIGFWFSPRDVSAVDPATEDFTADLVVACLGWSEEAASRDARLIEGSDNYGFGVWVLPGEIQDALEEEGAFVE